MIVLHWIYLLAILHPDNCLGQHIRHQRTRYMSGKNQLLASGYSPNEDEANENELPIVHFWKRPLQSLENSLVFPKKSSSRPLFSWDIPEQTTAQAISLESPTTSSSMVFQTTGTSEISSNDIISPSKKIQKYGSGKANFLKDYSALRSSYLFLSPSSSSKKKNKKSIDVMTKYKKREEHWSAWETTTAREPKRKKKKLGRKNGRRKPGSAESAGNRNRRIETSGRPPKISLPNESLPKKKFLPAKVFTGTTRNSTRSPCDSMENKCEHACENDNGTARCVCFKGFAAAGIKCKDVNECEVNNGGCKGKCINTIGSRKCVCSPGYRLDGSCIDVNECLLRNGHGPCQDRCVNTEGSYRCSCEGLPGTQLASDGHSCEPADTCDPVTHGCSHSCVKFSGRTFCVCPDGLELGDDWKTCRDVDECSNPKDYDVECESSCINTIGSYICSVDVKTTPILPKESLRKT